MEEAIKQDKSKIQKEFEQLLTEDLNGRKLVEGNIVKAKINLNRLNFENFFNSRECTENDVAGGKMQFYKHNNTDGLLITSAADHLSDEPNNLSQDVNSIYGKIVFILT